MFLRFLIFSVLIAVAIGAACKCKAPAKYNMAYFNKKIKNEYEQTETRKFVPVKTIITDNCDLVLVCDFPEIDEYQTNVQAAVGTLGSSTGTNLQGTNCVNGSKWHSEYEGDIQYVGCYVSISKF
ncbi:hypothetical protein CAEBREN_18761 [Caenorhabditis brenneri]|uniref:Uncharacterized protein n=1 Tax=Caenorhabditis brenneri TaxID=135651 RepID=G0NHK4_CAEBE|nr:hypothetical protein CAEBREN_18761 [Caenorhabditis brenneri]